MGPDRNTASSRDHVPAPRSILDSARIDPQPCPCGSGLRAARCCALSPLGLPAPSAATQLEPLMAAWRRERDRLGAEADQTTLLAVLDLAPNHAEALRALYVHRATHGPVTAANALLPRFVAHHPNDLWGRCELALRYLLHNDLRGAETQARSAVRLAPLNAEAQGIMGLVLLEQSRGHAAEYHLRRALALSRSPTPILLARLGTALRQQSRLQDSRQTLAEADTATQGHFEILYSWARTEEADQNLPRAAELYRQAEAAAPDNSAVRLARAELLARMGDRPAALAALDSATIAGDAAAMARGRILDRLDRVDEAFAAWREARAAQIAAGGATYPKDEVAQYLDKLRGFFTAARLANLPRATLAAGQPQPIFIVGFPRSGTTLLEQMLCMNPLISGGDELPMIQALTQIAPQLLGSPLAYPEALAELWMGDGQDGLDVLRDYYLRGARQLRASDPLVPWFTDKMPLNETHLGLIGLLFPASPILQLIRHPLDVVLSVFSNQLTHGFNCATALESTALHIARIAELVAHYRGEMALRHLIVRYEDLVCDSQAAVERVSAFVGVPFDPRCLRFTENPRYARTASHAQVTEQLYTRSRDRWRRYRDHLAPCLPILEPTIRRLGYDIA